MRFDTSAHISNAPLDAGSVRIVTSERRLKAWDMLRLVGRNLFSFALVGWLALVCTGCRSTTGKAVAPSVTDDSQIVAFENEHRMNTEVTGKVKVYKLLQEDDEGLKHERFLVMLSDGTTVLVAHSLDKAPLVPVSPEDEIIIHGEYVWNQKGGVIHWTHHSDSPRHEGGWIDFKGKRYE
jgi:Protein of unknown function (DUF3465)